MSCTRYHVHGNWYNSVLSQMLSLLQEWKAATGVSSLEKNGLHTLASFRTGNSWCIATIHTVWQRRRLPIVAPFRNGWFIVCGCVLRYICRNILGRRVVGFLARSRGCSSDGQLVYQSADLERIVRLTLTDRRRILSRRRGTIW
jgi:hypothetical protein